MIIDIPHKRVVGIYCLQNIVNNKRYIGSSIDIYYRLHRHRCDLKKNRHANLHLQASYNKYGPEVFFAIILEICSTEDLLSREQYYVDNLAPEYNKIRNVERHILPKESRDKISSTLSRRYKSGEIATYRQMHRWKTTYLYDLEWNFIAAYEYPKLAADTIGASYPHLSLCLRHPEKHKTILGKYKVSYLDPDKLGELGETPEVDNTEPSLGNS